MKTGKIGIYKITNKMNGKVYIGKSTDIDRRWMHHRNVNLKQCVYLNRALLKYGIDNFDFDILVTIECFNNHKALLCLLNSLEKSYITNYQSKDSSKGYNLTNGGDGILGFKFSNESKRKISNSYKNRTQEQKEHFIMIHNTPSALEHHSKASKKSWENMTGAVKEKIRQASKNKTFSKEGIESLRQAGRFRTGKDTKETRFKKGSSFRGKHLSEDHKKKIGEANKGKTGWKHSKEWIENQRKLITGIKRSAETCAKHRKENLTPEALAKLGSGTRGKKWYNNGVNKKAFAENTQPDGWVLGGLPNKN